MGGELKTIAGTAAACVAQVLWVLLLAPLVEGLVRKLTARIQSRQGPPIWQGWFDLLKLLGKEDLEAAEVPWLPRAAAFLSLGTLLFMACVLPLGAAPPLGEQTDAILLVHLVTLAGLGALMAGFGAGGTYSLIGSSREVMVMVLLEPLLAVAVVAGAVHRNSLAVAEAARGGVFAAEGFPWSGLVLLVVILLAFPAFVQRVPFDVAEAETEIMEGWLMECSGPTLALFKYTAMLKLVLYSALFVNLFLPWGEGVGGVGAWLWFWVKTGAVIALVATVAAAHARYRTDQAVRWFGMMLAAALGALWLAGLGY
ncbi:MAG: NADH-quinone oxidoreductase subunit H [Verrucomicrobia bacterium]|nr:MAG: NADH-quinone oxidoreductase subunit H [Verrucomicrobiota bacterium]